MSQIPDDIRKRLGGRRYHWCKRCDAPVRRVVSADRMFLGTTLVIECHGERITRLVRDTLVEDSRRLEYFAPAPVVTDSTLGPYRQPRKAAQ